MEAPADANLPVGKLADILHRFEAPLKRNGALSAQQCKVFGSIKACRTSRLGASVQAVCRCGKEIVAYNSCRDRHCPQCQGRATRKWVAAQSENLLPARYHHCVFTLPDTLNALARYNEAALYDLLFKASAATLKSFFANDRRFGGQGGFLGVLHTWGQRLQLHPHVHYIAACGALRDGEWRQDGGYLFEVRALSRVFRGKFLSGVERLAEGGGLALPPGWGPDRLRGALRLSALRHWVVYTKETCCGPDKVVEYVGRYAHKAAISEGRIREVGQSSVTFEWKDYRQDGRRRASTVPGESFARSFAQHVLPAGFRRIRQYGFWNPKGLAQARAAMRAQSLASASMARALIAVASAMEARHAERGVRCTRCGELAFEAELPAFESLAEFVDTS